MPTIARQLPVHFLYQSPSPSLFSIEVIAHQFGSQSADAAFSRRQSECPIDGVGCTKLCALNNNNNDNSSSEVVDAATLPEIPASKLTCQDDTSSLATNANGGRCFLLLAPRCCCRGAISQSVSRSVVRSFVRLFFRSV